MEGKQGNDDLSRLSARFRISNGIAATDSLQLVGPLVRVSGGGTADIAKKTLQFKIDPKLVMTLEGQGGSAESGRSWGAGDRAGDWGERGSIRISPEFWKSECGL